MNSGVSSWATALLLIVGLLSIGLLWVKSYLLDRKISLIWKLVACPGFNQPARVRVHKDIDTNTEEVVWCSVANGEPMCNCSCVKKDPPANQ